MLFVYYAGHGVMDNTTYCVLNGKRMYPMEKLLRVIAKQEGSYVMAVFDCCREKLPPQKMRGGGGGAVIADEMPEDVELGQAVNHENFIITYGCQPSSGVPVKSTLAKTYFRYLRKSGQHIGDDQTTKYLSLPGSLNFFQNTDGKCEHNIKAAQPLLLTWRVNVFNRSDAAAVMVQ